MISDWLLLGRPPTSNFLHPSPVPSSWIRRRGTLTFCVPSMSRLAAPARNNRTAAKSLRCYTRRFRPVREPQVRSGLTARQTEARVGRQAALPILGPSISTTGTQSQSPSVSRNEPNIVSYDPRPRSSTYRQIRRLRAVARRGTRLPRLAEGGNDMLGEELHLAHLFVKRHEALVEEPAEPFELTMAANLVQRLNLVLHLVDRAG